MNWLRVSVHSKCRKWRQTPQKALRSNRRRHDDGRTPQAPTDDNDNWSKQPRNTKKKQSRQIRLSTSPKIQNHNEILYKKREKRQRTRSEKQKKTPTKTTGLHDGGGYPIDSTHLCRSIRMMPEDILRSGVTLEAIGRTYSAYLSLHSVMVVYGAECSYHWFSAFGKVMSDQR